MRKLASKLRDQVEEAEEEMVDERHEDKLSMNLISPAKPILSARSCEINLLVMVDHEPVRKSLSPISA